VPLADGLATCTTGGVLGVRRLLPWIVAVSLAVIAIASAALLWLRMEEPGDAAGAGHEAAAAVAGDGDSPLAALATAVGIDEDDCGLDVLYAATGGITGNAEGESPVAAAPRARFALKFKDEVSPYRLISTFVLPGEQLEVEAVLSDQPMALEAAAEAGELVRLRPDRWRWTAPQEPGVHCLSVREPGAAAGTCLNVFVMVPYDGEDEVNGYRIGTYQRTPLRGQAAYAMPSGLVEVTRANLGTWVSPHFRLAQFVGKQESGYPKYVVLRTRLLLKLESVLEELGQRGIRSDTLYVMSGYRTPFYNASIGNRTKYSRHSYGDAADVFVDRDRDGRMDDINGDGKSNLSDALLVYGMVETLSAETWFEPFEGGLGIYPPNPRFGPMVHLDTRGTKTRWKG
jgi:hypothetical protein